MYKWVDRPVEDHEQEIGGHMDEEDYHPEAIVVWLFVGVVAGIFTGAIVLLWGGL